jgi:peptidoglycan/LPS O-acetylase OafA/YrhL
MLMRMSESGVRELGYVPALDGLRGVAVLLVVLYHTTYLVNIFAGKVTTVRGFGWLNSFASGSFLGVDIFFVLSGFLITTLLLEQIGRSGTISFRNFYRRRALRLLPALVVLLAAHFVYSLIAVAPALFGGHAHRAIPLRKELNTVAAALTYVFNYVLVLHPRSVVSLDLRHLWSLAVEEQFYLVWPCFLALLVRWRRPGGVPGVIVAAIVIVMADRVLLFHHAKNLYVRTDARADTLLIGALLAWAWTRGFAPKLPRIAAWLSTSLILAFVATSKTTSASLFYGGFTIFACAVGVVILAVVDNNWGAILRVRPLRAIGRVSYGLYLWHLPIFIAVDRQHLFRNSLARIAFSYALTGVVTWLSWTLIERPALARRGKRH